MPTATNSHEMFDSDMKIKEFADNISELSKNKFDSLLNTIESKSTLKSNGISSNNSLLSNLSNIFEEEVANSKKLRNVYASITQTNGYDYNSSKLICVSTGTKCINGEFMSQMGIAINDWLVLFFYSKLFSLSIRTCLLLPTFSLIIKECKLFV